jgi:outer membrane protein assembly factor BamB
MMPNKQQPHDANEQLPSELLQVAQRYARLTVPRPSSQQTRELIAQLQRQTLPEALDPQPMRPLRSGRRRQPVLEVLVAVVLIGILIGSFVVLLSVRRAPAPAHVKPVPAPEIVVSVEIRGKGIASALVAQWASDGKTLWTFVLTQQFGVPTTLAVENQVVYAKSWQQVYALRATDGKLLWQEHLPWYGATTPGTPPDFSHDTSALLVVDHNMVFTQLFEATSATTVLYTLRASDGRVLWHVQTGTGEHRFAVQDGKVYVPEALPGNVPQLVALQETTGEPLWSYPTAGSSGTQGNPFSAVAFEQQDETVYVVSIVWAIPPGGTPFDLTSRSMLLALSAQKGHLLWSSPIQTSIPTSQDVGPLFVDQNRLLFGTGQQKICAYQTGNGHLLWCTSPIMHASSTFALVNHVIYTLGGQDDTILEALDPANGYLLWTGETLPGSQSASIIGTWHNTLFLTALNSAGNGSLIALSLSDGHQLWSTDSSNRTLAVVIGS